MGDVVEEAAAVVAEVVDSDEDADLHPTNRPTTTVNNRYRLYVYIQNKQISMPV